ncbi:uncharacterized protein LOC113509724 [Galleria mellonella]|uniref:Uncharacterized protein LOC113509724 n=1 Tax=Galleria mellonella TaxID=7137 RepID=A0A6J1WFY5_GALME|nr:uncharacterized protein LOC113509724 [Galleria mellonella]
MNVYKQNLSANSSVASSQISSYEDTDTTKIKNYVKDLLKSRIFLGRYIERRLIDQHIGYRDVVVISAAETELKRDLLEGLQKLRHVCSTHWIGITDREILGQGLSGICLWTEIENQPFGPFWFQIKTIKFREQEVIVLLKCIRHISDAFLELEPILTGAAKKQKEINDSAPENIPLSETYKEIIANLKNALSISNVKEFFTFLFAFIIAVFTGSTAFINFLGNFVLALIREMSILIKNSTPMFLGMLDFFSKIVGGFYILLAMFFKPNNPVPINKRYIANDRQQRQNYYDNQQYDDRNFD